MAKLSDEKIAEIQKRYAECGVYAQVARELGVSPTTVKKYVSSSSDSARSPKVSVPIIKFEGDPLPIEQIVSPLTHQGWLDWCSFTDDDLKSVESLKGEL